MCSFGIKIKLNSKMSSFRDLKSSEPSLCIPRVFSNITEDRVWNVLDELELGDVDRIDMVERETREGELYQRVFIHFKSWSSSAENVRERLVNGEEIKIVYDDPWFWKVSASRSKRPRAQTDRRPPRIEFSEASVTKKQEVRNVRPTKRDGVSYAAAAGKCGDAIVGAQQREEEEEALNKGLSVDAARKLSERMANTPPPPPPTSPLTRTWGSA